MVATFENQKRAVGVFTSRQKTEQALNELKSANLSMDKVSVLANTEDNQQVGDVEVSNSIGTQSVDTTRVVADALNAGTWGSVLVGLSSMAVPGIGYIIAAGSVGAAFVTTVTGMAVSAGANNNMVNALVGLGIPEERARHYNDRLQQRYYLVMFDGTDEEIQRAEGILRSLGIEYWGIYDFPQAQTDSVN